MLRFLVAVALAIAATTSARSNAATLPQSVVVSSARAQSAAEPPGAAHFTAQSPRAREHGLGGDRAPTGAAGRRASGGTPYDKAGRVTLIEHSDGTTETYAYRPDGELIEAANATTSLSFERDLLGRILKEAQGQHWVTSEYDALGRRNTVRSSKGLERWLAAAFSDPVQSSRVPYFAQHNNSECQPGVTS